MNYYFFEVIQILVISENSLFPIGEIKDISYLHIF